MLTVGGGGREHAIVEALHRSGAEIFAVMKNNNPGIARRSKDFKLMRETDVDAVLSYALECGVEMAFIGPEAPLGEGLVDALEAKGIGCIGPNKAAARIETSKSFMRDLLKRYDVPGNLGFASFDDAAEAAEYIRASEAELVVKPVGLTGGKGVKVQGEHLRTDEEAIEYVNEIFEQDIGGAGVILEERAIGEEFTQMVFCDGRHIAPMPLVQDHKRAYEGDVGPNTGGMGSYSSEDHLLPFVTEADRREALGILQRIVDAMRADGCPYKGVMYGQFMLTTSGPRIIEINARFGDPEAMNVLPILRTSLVDICRCIVTGDLSPEVDFERKATVCKYVVPEGYGTDSKAGLPISVDEIAIEAIGAHLYYSSVNQEDGRVLTTTSRSVAVVGVNDSIAEAERACEAALGHVKGDAIFVRHDIGKAELVQRRVEHMKELRRGVQ